MWHALTEDKGSADAARVVTHAGGELGKVNNVVEHFWYWVLQRVNHLIAVHQTQRALISLPVQQD
jgi:hypothetical protein